MRPRGPTEMERRQPACLNCRRHKVKCVHSNPNDMESPCLRCIKGKKECVYDTGLRRKVKLQDSDMNASNASYSGLMEFKSAPTNVSSGDNSGHIFAPPPHIPMSRNVPEVPMDMSSMVSAMPLNMNTPNVSSMLLSNESSPGMGLDSPNGSWASAKVSSQDDASRILNSDIFLYKQHGRKISNVDVALLRDSMLQSWQTLNERDIFRIQMIEEFLHKSIAKPGNSVIAQGIISREEAQMRLEIYRSRIFTFLGLADVGDATVEELAEQRPLVFHTIMDITSRCITDPLAAKTAVVLHSLAYVAVISQAFVFSTKNMDLLQALLLQIYFYNEPEFYHRSKIDPLTATAVSLASDLGMGSSMTSTEEPPEYEQIVTPYITMNPHDESCYRAWVAGFCVSCHYLLSLRRLSNRLWNRYTQEACEFLVASGLPSNVLLARHARYLQTHQEITLHIYRRSNDPAAPNYNDQTTISLVAHLDQEIERIYNEGNMLGIDSSDRIGYLTVRSYLHHGVLYTDYNSALGRSPFTSFTLNFFATELSYEAARSFKICYETAYEAMRMTLARPLDTWDVLILPQYYMFVFCCSVVLKCRALALFNRLYADALGHPVGDAMEDVARAANLLDQASARFPQLSVTISLSFLLKLLMSHNDAVLQYLMAQQDSDSPQEGPTVNLATQHIPGQKEYQEQATKSRNPSINAENFIKTSSLFPADMEMDGDHPIWQMSDDFWQSVFPKDNGWVLDF